MKQIQYTTPRLADPKHITLNQSQISTSTRSYSGSDVIRRVSDHKTELWRYAEFLKEHYFLSHQLKLTIYFVLHILSI